MDNRLKRDLVKFFKKMNRNNLSLFKEDKSKLKDIEKIEDDEFLIQEGLKQCQFVLKHFSKKNEIQLDKEKNLKKEEIKEIKKKELEQNELKKKEKEEKIQKDLKMEDKVKENNKEMPKEKSKELTGLQASI